MSATLVERDIKKLNKRLRVCSDQEECAEIHNMIGGLYTEIGLYDEAKSHHEDELEIYRKLGKPMQAAVAYRLIGESKAALGNFEDAIKDIEKFLALAKKYNNQIETQRALTTIGRVHLMHAQHLKEEDAYHRDIIQVALEAQRRLELALDITKTMKDQIDEKEYCQMRAGLLVNKALVKELRNKRQDCINNLLEARDLYKSARLKEDLYRCLNLLSSTNRQDNSIEAASKFSKEALELAQGIGKKLLTCDAYIELGLVHINQQQYKEACRFFKRADHEQSPSFEDQEKAKRFRIIGTMIAKTYEDLANKKGISSEQKSIYAERLGDLLVKIGCYQSALHYYWMARAEAKIARRSRKDLAKILYSIAETFSDNNRFDMAAKCFQSELNLSPADSCQTLFRLAQMYDTLNKSTKEVCEAYDKALESAGNSTKMKYFISESYLAYMRYMKLQNTSKYEDIQRINRSASAAYVEDDGPEELDPLEDEIVNFNLQDVVFDDDEEDDDDEIATLGRRKPKKRIKTNEVGETPLHQAAINGDLRRVKFLLSQGHKVNLKDNLGWTPLHEACNWGHYEIAQILIENGADVSFCGPDGVTPLHDAASCGHVEVMRLLIKNGANVIALTDKGGSVLDAMKEFKSSRCYDKLDNFGQAEFREVELEVKGLMDKCGFELITSSRSANKPDSPEPEMTQPKPKKSSLILSEEPSSAINMYKGTINNMKRKKKSPDVQPAPKRNITALVTKSKFNPSSSTKDWLQKDSDPIEMVSSDSEPEAPTTRKQTQRDPPISIDSQSDFEMDLDLNPDSDRTPQVSQAPRPESSNLMGLDEDEIVSIRSTTTNQPEPEFTRLNAGDVYKANCQDYLDFISSELSHSASSNRLDLSFMRFPSSHIDPVCKALDRRDYTSAKLTGASCLFVSNNLTLLRTMTTWTLLTSLDLVCVGLIRSQFEFLCERLKMPNLKRLDLSHNCIVYLAIPEFSEQIDCLRQANPKLTTLDLSYNQLKFVTTIQSGQSDLTNLADHIPLLPISSNFQIIANSQNSYTVSSM